jgi:hypothetical protein
MQISFKLKHLITRSSSDDLKATTSELLLGVRNYGDSAPNPVIKAFLRQAESVAPRRAEVHHQVASGAEFR